MVYWQTGRLEDWQTGRVVDWKTIRLLYCQTVTPAVPHLAAVGWLVVADEFEGAL